MQAKVAKLSEDEVHPVSVKLLRQVLDPATVDLQPVADRIAFVDEMDAVGKIRHERRKAGMGFQWRAKDSWVVYSGAALDSANLPSDTALSRLPHPQSMFQLALGASYDWYVSAKLAEQPRLLKDPVQGQYILKWALRSDLWTMQEVLLDGGADPNLYHELGRSAWQMLLEQTLNIMRIQSADLEERGSRLLRTLTVYLDHGADPRAYVTEDCMDMITSVKLSGIVHLALATMSGGAHRQIRDDLERSYRNALEGGNKTTTKHKAEDPLMPSSSNKCQFRRRW